MLSGICNFFRAIRSPPPRVKEATFLGVILDEHLTWKSHIHNVARKVSKAAGIIYKSTFCLDS